MWPHKFKSKMRHKHLSFTALPNEKLWADLVFLDFFHHVEHDKTVQLAQKWFSLFEVTKLIRLTWFAHS